MNNLNNNNIIIKEDEKSDKILRDSEDLVKIVLENKVAKEQIKRLYRRARTKGKVEFEVFLKYQMGRSDGEILPRVFGDKLLLLYEKYQYQKHDLVTILKYVLMLHEYERYSPNNNFNLESDSPNNKNNKVSYKQSKPEHHPIYNSIDLDIGQKIEQIIKNNTKEYGFDKLEIEGPSRQGYRTKLNLIVHLKKFHGDPKELSDHLKNILQSQISAMSIYEIGIWIERIRV